MKEWWLKLRKFWKSDRTRQTTIKQFAAISSAFLVFATLTLTNVIVPRPALLPPPDYEFLARTKAVTMSTDMLEQKIRSEPGNIEGLVFIDGLQSVVVMERGIENDRYVEGVNTEEVSQLAEQSKVSVSHVQAVEDGHILKRLGLLWKATAAGLLLWLGLFLFRKREADELPSRIVVAAETLLLVISDISLRTGFSGGLICWSLIVLIGGGNVIASQSGYYNMPSYRPPPASVTAASAAAPYQAQRLLERHPSDIASVSLIDDASAAYVTVKQSTQGGSGSESKEPTKSYAVYFGNSLEGQARFKQFADLVEKEQVSFKHLDALDAEPSGMTTRGYAIFLGLNLLTAALAILTILGSSRLSKGSDDSDSSFSGRPQYASGSSSGLGNNSRARNQNQNPNDAPIGFKDIAGCDEAVEQLRIVVKKVTRPRLYRLFGAPVPRGICFFGPPGTGKTTMARALAGEIGGLDKRCHFEAFSGSQFVEMYVGKGALRVREAYTKARAEARRNNTPSIIFIDEFDALARKRGGIESGGDQEYSQTINQLLTEMDGFANRGLVITIAATNRLDTLDPAVLRPGRLDMKIEVGLPDTKGRRQILSLYLNKLKLVLKGSTAEEQEAYKLALIDSLAKRSVDFSGAEIEGATKQAATIAVERSFGELTEDLSEEQENEDAWKDRAIVTEEDLFEGVERMAFGLKLKSKVRTDEERWATAIHEIAHADAATDPVHLISIARTEKSLGMVQTIPSEERLDWSKEQLNERLRMILAGRAGQKVIIGVETAGASDDFNKASILARQMVGTLGMSAELGNCALTLDSNGFPSGQVSNYLIERFDRAWTKIIDDAQAHAEKRVASRRRHIVSAARVLYREERMKGETLLQIFAAMNDEDNAELPEDKIPEKLVNAAQLALLPAISPSTSLPESGE